jgi:hypothetical protein
VWAQAVWPSVLNLFPWSSAFPTAAGGIKSGNIFLTLNTFTIAALVAEFEGAGAFGTCLVVFNRLEVVFSKASCALSTRAFSTVWNSSCIFAFDALFGQVVQMVAIGAFYTFGHSVVVWCFASFAHNFVWITVTIQALTCQLVSVVALLACATSLWTMPTIQTFIIRTWSADTPIKYITSTLTASSFDESKTEHK